MTADCPECGTETHGERGAVTHFASRYDYECPECGHEWSWTKWS